MQRSGTPSTANHLTVIPAKAGIHLLLLLLSNSLFVASPEGRRTGAEPWMANRERALLLPGRGIDLGKWKALSFGYFSLGKQRKVTRAPQAIGSLDCDSSLLLRVAGKAWKVPGFPPSRE
ncbi:hypothetical protein [Lysobacter soli]|uniref:hypothetical protein n=1 Tax=Lysobacter soli TaxID=453783 RepID=UPI00240F3068|nr:hypothetical protein [Lysobacter soli]MDG2518844.1 hypothetical protein [Lysobacter soli]